MAKCAILEPYEWGLSMKTRLRWLVGLLPLLALTGLFWSTIGHAQSFTKHVTKDKTIHGSVYAAGESVTIDGTVHGDVFCAAQRVTINGTITGDVLCAGRQITVNGKVEGSVRAAGQEVRIEKANIGHALTLAGQKVVVSKDATIGQDVTLAGDETELFGTVGRDVTVASGTLAHVGGSIGRNVQFNGGELELADDTVVKGKVSYASEQTISKGDNVTVSGGIEQHEPQKEGTDFASGILDMLGVIAAFMTLCMVLVLVLPKLTHRVSEVPMKSLFKSMACGLMALFAFPVAIILLFISTIGIPLAILTVLLGTVLALLSGPVVAYYLGRLLLAKTTNPLYFMLLGSGVLGMLVYAPVVGGLVLFVAYLIGSGAIVLAAKRHWPQPDYKV